jgi:hypothetical protein
MGREDRMTDEKTSLSLSRTISREESAAALNVSLSALQSRTRERKREEWQLQHSRLDSLTPSLSQLSGATSLASMLPVN